MLKSHQRGDLTTTETKVDYLPFAKVLYEERNGFKRFGAANGSTFNTIKASKERKCGRFTLRRLTKPFEWDNTCKMVLFQVRFVRSHTKER